MVEDDYAAAHRESAHFPARCGDYAGGFMAEDARRRQQVVFDLFEIGVTDAAALDADQQFARAYGRRWDRFH